MTLLLISLIFMALGAVKWEPAQALPALVGEPSNPDAEPRVKGMRMDCMGRGWRLAGPNSTEAA